MKGKPWGHMSSLAPLPLLACVLPQNAAGPHCHLTLPDTHPKAAGPFNSLGSNQTSFGRLPQLRSGASGDPRSIAETLTWVIDSCWLQFSIILELVQLPQSTRFLTGKRWFLELETFSCENGSFDKGLSFCDGDNQNEKNLFLNQNEKKWKTETVTLSVLTFPIQNSSESFPCCVKMFPFWFFFFFICFTRRKEFGNADISCMRYFKLYLEKLCLQVHSVRLGSLHPTPWVS